MDERILSSGWLSPTACYRVATTGEIGAKELGHLITMLELLRGFFAEDERPPVLNWPVEEG